MKVGDTARISVDAYPDREIRGVVREIASTALTRNAGTQEEVTNFEVKISIPDRSVRCGPGMSATADIETATVKNVVAVPIQSVTVRSTGSRLVARGAGAAARARGRRATREDNRADVTNEAAQKQKERAQRAKLQRVVFVKNGETVTMQKVETGIADNTFIEIRSGLKPATRWCRASYTRHLAEAEGWGEGRDREGEVVDVECGLDASPLFVSGDQAEASPPRSEQSCSFVISPSR